MCDLDLIMVVAINENITYTQRGIIDTLPKLATVIVLDFLLSIVVIRFTLVK
ncbi:hypothetical protein [cyanobacterium endosymbiont of Epithemia turgida]|uniref:hypothetical protein n=1 Tax=cyanobacterium endosymbiont of Epithemia turgida TaxID=718217 RepID=UPI0004D0D7B0|nr:hypothetical protein [cyanobacterium endosymbiont of Epithemia turgida]BAP18267.1 hypothetical protein ETSB_1534 [cyanobacterium endosymbiont of Epithemia turgida isolate EtSB Lake Yunoko]